MDFSREKVERELNPASGNSRKNLSRLILHGIKICFLALLLVIGIAGSFTVGVIQGIVDRSPDAASLAVTPLGIASTIYDSDGKAVETLIASGSNRDPVPYSRLPQDLIDAFVAIEDERFWTHEGVDIRGILRSAASLLLNGKISGGASTITQQLVKNNVFNGGMEKGWGARFIRKFQEQYLSLVLEAGSSKEDILTNYLNSINLGQNCLGVQVAAKRYFRKDVRELTLSECACIAGITQNPWRYNPITFPGNNRIRRQSVLDHMLEQNYISQAEYEAALEDTEALYERIAENNMLIQETSSTYSYYTDAVIEQVLSDLQHELGYSETDAITLLYSGGLNIYTPMDSRIQNILDQEVNNPANYPKDAFQYSFSYTLKVTLADGSNATYTEYSIKKRFELDTLLYDSKEEIEALVQRFKEELLTEEDSVRDERIYYTLEPQLSAVIIDQSTGYVQAINGGRGEKSVSRALNRATGTYRSPGSTFKVLGAYAPGLDTDSLTLSDVVNDLPYSYDGAVIRDWWTAGEYLGYCSARQGIVYSMNVVTVNMMMTRVGVNRAFEYLKNFGISSLVEGETIKGKYYTDLGPTLCLGGLTNGANLIDVTNAYAAIANGGTYHEYTFYTRITDHYGNVLIDHEAETHRVIDETTAYLLTNAMAESMTDKRLKNTWYTASSGNAALKDIPAAGKSGTSTDNSGKSRDYWFVGYTGYYTMGVWSGFDDGGVTLDGNVTKNNYHKTVWKAVMQKINEELPKKGFVVPAGITAAKVCALSGKLAMQGVCDKDTLYGSYIEYYRTGTEPTEYCDCHIIVDICSESKKEANEYCPSVYEKIYYDLPACDYTTLDTPYIYREGENPSSCTLHNKATHDAELESEEAAGRS